MPSPAFVVSLGSALVQVACTPEADLWVTPGGVNVLFQWYYAGQCPASGLVTCGNSMTIKGQILSVALTGVSGSESTCFQDTRVIYGGAVVPVPGASGTGGTGGSFSGTVTFGEPFNLSPELGTAVGGAIVSVFIAAAVFKWYRMVMDSNHERD